MNTFFADIFSSLLKVLHVLVILGLLFFAFGGSSSRPLGMFYSIVAFIVYVVIVGFISVVLAMYENLVAIRKLMEITTESRSENAKHIDVNFKKEPLYEQVKS